LATSDSLVTAAETSARRRCRAEIRRASTHVYNPLIYAWRAHAMYLRRYGNAAAGPISRMNPGPSGWRKPVSRSANRCRARLARHSGQDRPFADEHRAAGDGIDARAAKSAVNVYGIVRERFGAAEEFSRNIW